MKRKVLAKILHAALVPVTLVACSGKTDSTNSTDSGPRGCALASSTATQNGCGLQFTLAGPASACESEGSCNLPAETCATLCGKNACGQTMQTSNACDVCTSGSNGETLVTCWYPPCGGCGQTGRRPAGLAPREARSPSHPVAAYLAEMAWLEAASVPAFRRLERELSTHGAPKRLLRACRRAAADETRHARRVGGLARRAGARTDAPRVSPGPARSLEAIAIENAVEGCVRETFGAAVAAAQALRARDPVVRGVMKRIARDEASHARLSWAIGSWLSSRLDRAARARVASARRRAVAQLLMEVSVESDRAVVRDLGIPDARDSRAMHASLDASLWSARRPAA